MLYHLLANAFVALHFAFVIYVVLGGLLVRRWPRTVWLHLPAALWGAGIELLGGVCPLTWAENWALRQAGESGYEGGFVEEYLLPVLYPTGLTRQTQLILGLLVIVANVGIYGWVIWRRRQERG